MSHGENTAGQEPAARQGRVRRARQWFQRARGPGHERHTLLVLGKSTLAATVAWFLAYDVFAARSPAFAPFSAVLTMQVTVYRSLLDSLRYVAAVAAGVAVQAALGFLVGPDLLTFALVALVALVIGRWPALVPQGSQVATAAFFAFSTYVQATSAAGKATQLGQIILLVLVGCGVGVLINLLVVPPLHYRRAEHGIRTLAHGLCDLIGDLHPALREGELDAERIRHWRARAERSETLISQARSGLSTARESLYYNPRRLFRRHRVRGGTGFEGYRAVLEALERALHQMTSLIRSLGRWETDREASLPSPFLHSYADFLASVGRITQVLAGLDEDRLSQQAREVGELTDEAWECCRRVSAEAEASGLPLADPALPYGVLVVESARLMEELQHTGDVLRRYTERGARGRRTGTRR
ncbi:aromatic acid exporter family protein [Streptomyces sp. RS10V-4]|uniref:FUSC family protein n=1 Tax=Streptomyces rhizoryzae TaxID=2932493 RepID=UPI0020031679|nr:aromatic acid exporter family protein [Streptomyces rhizoryzae]MCK7624956.1 aromatic acid exporter family protein [Streptomyces rhizoryzae]